MPVHNFQRLTLLIDALLAVRASNVDHGVTLSHHAGAVELREIVVGARLTTVVVVGVWILTPIVKVECPLKNRPGEGEVRAQDGCVGLPKVPDGPVWCKGVGEAVIFVQSRRNNLL